MTRGVELETRTSSFSREPTSLIISIQSPNHRKHRSNYLAWPLDHVLRVREEVGCLGNHVICCQSTARKGVEAAEATALSWDVPLSQLTRRCLVGQTRWPLQQPGSQRITWDATVLCRLCVPSVGVVTVNAEKLFYSKHWCGVLNSC